MAWTFEGVRDQLKTRLDTITGLINYDTVPPQVQVPASMIAPAAENPVDYDDTLDGLATLQLTITILVQKVVESVAQDAADAYLNFTGARSIPAAVNSGPIASVWDYAIVKGARRYGEYTFGSAEGAVHYLGVEFAVEVGVS